MANQLNVYREGIVISTFDIDEETIFSEKLQGARTITCPVAAENALPLQDGDYINHNGEVYIINTLPDFTKDGGKLQKDYNITFEAEFYLLLDTFILNDQSHAVFPKYGSAVDHLNMIFANANRNDTGWTVGEVAATGGELINYNWTYVRTALDEIAATFKLEWSFTGRTIRMVSQVGVDTGLTFEVGRGKGLHQISRTQDSGKSVVTRVFGVGGSTNLDYTYRGGLEPNLIFDGRYVETPGVTAGTERVREGRYENDQIYPRFNGNVTGVVVNRNAQNLITSVVITDTAIDFDINSHLQEGITAKVSFRTGALTGADFEIASYNATTKAIELIPVADTNGYVLPNDLNLPLVGDKFTLLDIRMPVAYVTAAELELRNAALQYLNDNNMSRLLFGAKPDQKHLRDNNIVLKVGDRATVIETEIDVNEILRFTEISYPLVNTFDVTAAIGNEIAYNRVVKLFAEVLQTQRDVQVVDRRNAVAIKRYTQNLRAFESSVFDTDGMFDTDKMNIGVLTFALGIIGVKSQNFNLNGVYISDNYNGDANSVMVSAGELIHNEYSNAGNLNVWVMQALIQSGLTAASLYYVYAKCSKTSQVGTWVVTTAQIKPEDEAGFWMFLAGVIYPVNAGTRDSEFSNGIADINPRRLKIGAIESRTGGLKIDLDNNTVYGKLIFGANSTGYNNISDKPDLSIYATQDFVDAIKDELQGQIDGAITTWFYPYVPTLSNVPASGWATDEEKNAQLGDLFYDTATGYAYRFQVSGGVYSWAQISDTDITLALQKAQQAQDTADGKRRVFTVTPYTPYDDGDLWSQGTGGDLMRCNVARASGAYVASDWGLASKYTDDTAVDNLVIGGRNLLLLSGLVTTNGNYLMRNYYLSEPVIVGEEYVLTIWGDLAPGKLWSPWFSAGSVFLGVVTQIESGKWGLKFTGVTNSVNYLSMYCSPPENTADSTITKIKLEKGNKATDWTPAPEDVKAEADKAAADAQAAAINYADAKAYAAGKILYRDAEFKDGLNGISVYNNAQNGTVVIDRLPRSAWGEGTAHSLPTTSPYGVRIMNTGPAAPGLGGFFFGTPSRANAKFVTRIIAYIPVGYTISWQSNAIGDGSSNTWATSRAGTGSWTEYINVTKCGSSGAFSSTNFFNLDGPENMEWYLASATVYDVTDSEVDYIKDATAKANAAQAAAIAQAAATAETIAQSKADIAQAAAISAAATDATNKANAAKAAAEAASNAFAQTAANNAASDAEIAAAADASNKATAAYNDAVAAAAQAQANLTAQLKTMAYRDINEVADQGVTVIDNGSVVTFAVNAAYVKANIVNADYVVGLELNFVQGSIGGIEIQNNSITSSNGNFSVTSGGVLTAVDAVISGEITATSGTIGGFEIDSQKLTSVGTNSTTELSGEKGTLYFQHNDNISGAFVGNYFGGVPTPAELGIAPGIFWEHRTQAVGENVAFVVSAKNGLKNIALDIKEGAIRANGAVYNTNVVTVSSGSYSCTANDYVVLISSTGSITLPSAGENGRTIIVTNISGSSRAINGGNFNIRDGSSTVASFTLSTGNSRKFIFASSLNNWVIVN